MNIKIITIHCMHNPGSVFQAYALQQYLSEKNEVEIIDYRPHYLYSENSDWKLAVKKVLYGREYKSRADKFDRFISQEMKLTNRFDTYEQLSAANLQADVFMTGSDQLWNSDFPCGNDEAFYLAFVDRGRKVAYSTSVGKKEIDSRNMQLLKERLPLFSAVSVREKSTAQTLTRELKRSISWVCDPVLLLPAQHYRQFIDLSIVPVQPYAVVYMAGSSEQLTEIVNYYRQKGLKIVLAGGFTKRCQCDQHIKDLGPLDFLSLIYGADTVISSSFHATAFCHLFHKNFVSLVPERNGERILNLLEVSGLRNRGIERDFDREKASLPIDWHAVDCRLNEYVASSMQFLDSVLEE